MEKENQIKIFSKGLKDRKLFLTQLQSKIKYFESQSDSGWLMTLGADKLGMLMAV